MKRPKSVTVIAWLLIASCLIGLVSTSIFLLNPAVNEILQQDRIQLYTHYLTVYIGLIFCIVAAFAMLKRRNWGRLLYVILGVVGYIIGFFTMPISITMLPGLIVFIIFVFLLYRSNVNEYFKGTVEQDAIE